MIGKRLKSKSWWIKCVLFEVNTIIICNVRATNAKRPFYLMKLKTTKRRKWQKKNEVSQEEREKKNWVKIISSSLIADLNQFFIDDVRFIAHTLTQSCACFRFHYSLSHRACTNAQRINENNRTLKTGTFSVGSFSILFAHIFRHLSSSLSLLITNKKHVSAIYFARNSLPRICHYGIFLFFVLELVV